MQLHGIPSTTHTPSPQTQTETFIMISHPTDLHNFKIYLHINKVKNIKQQTNKYKNYLSFDIFAYI